MDAALKTVAFARKGDVVVVWKLDRLGRSLRDLIDVVNSLQDRGVGLRSLQEAIDTTTPAGKLTFHIFAALAEFERDCPLPAQLPTEPHSQPPPMRLNPDIFSAHFPAVLHAR